MVNGYWMSLGGLTFGLCADMKVRPIHMSPTHPYSKKFPDTQSQENIVMLWVKKAQ